jgi:PAS domain S-box-containing protein
MRTPRNVAEEEYVRARARGARKLGEARVGDLQFRLLVEEVTEYAILMLGPDGRVQTWNAGAERIKGYREEEIVGRHFSVFYTAEDRATHAPDRALRLARESGSHMEEGWRVRKDGSRFWASVVLTAIHDDRGALLGFAKVTRDLSDRKRADDEIRALNAELEAFSASVSHDLRSPLRAIDGFLGLVDASAAGRLTADERTFLARARHAATRMASLVDHLLALSRATRSTIVREDLDLARMAREVVEDLRSVDRGRTVEFIAPDRLRASGDPQLVRALLENLLGNAWKFTRRSESPRVELGREDRGGSSAWFVRDNGVGFDPADAERLFRPFERLHSAAEFEGSGVGLTTVARVVARHGGRTWAGGAPGNGATFWFTLGEPA